jgi:oxalate decarboxylase/phosphoglucose isomerase-like protein (cupin superfamily)
LPGDRSRAGGERDRSRHQHCHGTNLEGARVVLKGTGRETVTDSQGVYRFDDVSPGQAAIAFLLHRD